MENKETTNSSSKTGLIITAAVILILIAGGLVYWFILKPSNNTIKTETNRETDKDAGKKPVNETNNANASSGEAASAKPDDSDKPPAPALSAKVTDTTILASDPEPEVTLKQNQQQFIEYMNAGDYANAKNLLDSYFATTAYSIESDNTFENFTYYYEIQNQYKESALYQLDFLESNMGLENIIETNPRYQHLLQTLPYASVTDDRIDKMAASAARWKEVQELLENNKIDTAIKNITEYMDTGAESIYAYYNLGKAYAEKADYFAEAKAYYIFLIKMKEQETLNQLERDYEYVLTNKLRGLYEAQKITEQQKDFLEDEITSDMKPY